MNSRYKLIISSKNLYKEIELAPTDGEVKVGTSPECTVRLRKELFFSPIELNLQRIGDEWSIICSDNLYFTNGDVRKLLTKQLIHGDELFVKYQDSDNDVFSLSFMIDFGYAKKDYDIEIDITEKSQVKIGGTKDSNIQFIDTYLGNDTLVLDCSSGKCNIIDNGSKYGVFVNGAKIEKSAQLHDCDFFSIVGFSFYYKAGKIYTSSANEMIMNGLTSRPVEIHSTHFKYPKFNRNSRVQYVIPEEDLEIQQAVQKPSKPNKNIVMSLIPSIVMLAMTIVLRGIIGGGGTFVIYSAVSMGLGIIMSIVSFVKENKNYKKEIQERIETYNKYIDEKKNIIEAARANELRIRNLIYESLENSISEVDSFGRRLFEKNQQDKDFLQVYLGRGRVESANQIVYNKQEFVDLEDPLSTIPADIAEKYKYIENAPIISDFNASCGVGVVGPKSILEQILKNITLDISIRHFYNEVKMVYILSEDYTSKMQWIRWLQNVDNQKLGVKNIVCDEESKNTILEDLYITLSYRERNEKNFDSFPDYIYRGHFRKDVTINLIQTGAFDCFNQNREAILRTYNALEKQIDDIGKKEKAIMSCEQFREICERHKEESDDVILFHLKAAGYKNKTVPTSKMLQNKINIYKSDIENIKNEIYEIGICDSASVDPEEKLAKEKALIGVYISGHPLDYYENEGISLDDMVKHVNDKVTIQGIINEVVILHRKKDGKEFAKLEIETRSGLLEVMVFATFYEKLLPEISENKVVNIFGKIIEEEMDSAAYESENNDEHEEGKVTEKRYKMFAENIRHAQKIRDKAIIYVPNMVYWPTLYEYLQRFHSEQAESMHLIIHDKLLNELRTTDIIISPEALNDSVLNSFGIKKIYRA